MPDRRHDPDFDGHPVWLPFRIFSLATSNFFFAIGNGAIESSVDSKKNGYRGNLELSGRHSGADEGI